MSFNHRTSHRSIETPAPTLDALIDAHIDALEQKVKQQEARIERLQAVGHETEHARQYLRRVLADLLDI
jgi:hypothetical protein